MSFQTTYGNIGDDGLPDYIYYNFDIINNRTSDLNQSGVAAVKRGPGPPSL